MGDPRYAIKRSSAIAAQAKQFNAPPKPKKDTTTHVVSATFSDVAASLGSQLAMATVWTGRLREGNASPGDLEAFVSSFRATRDDARSWLAMGGLVAAVGREPAVPREDRQSLVGLVERADAALDALDAGARASDARTATAADRAEESEPDAKEGSDDPVAFCDRSENQGTKACWLGGARRDDLRKKIIARTDTARDAWSIAIQQVSLETRLAALKPGLEQQLGSALLGLLTGLVARGASTTVRRRADRAFTPSPSATFDDTYVPPVPGAEGETLAALADKGVRAAAAHATTSRDLPSMTVEDLVTAVSPDDLPTGRVELLHALADAPFLWAAHIHEYTPCLFDDDLVALERALPPAKVLLPSHFEPQVLDTLRRYASQVDRIDADVRAVIVVGESGAMRHALVARDRAAPPQLHGEWAGSEATTGKWAFVEWIDEDMAAMALNRTLGGAPGRIGFSGTPMSKLIHRTADSEFWSSEALAKLREWDVATASAGGSP